MTEPRPCPDCDATQTVTPCWIARRGGGRAVIEFREVEHASTCPTLRGIVR
jgi:hypothetical protein